MPFYLYCIYSCKYLCLTNVAFIYYWRLSDINRNVFNNQIYLTCIYLTLCGTFIFSAWYFSEKYNLCLSALHAGWTSTAGIKGLCEIQVFTYSTLQEQCQYWQMCLRNNRMHGTFCDAHLCISSKLLRFARHCRGAITVLLDYFVY